MRQSNSGRWFLWLILGLLAAVPLWAGPPRAGVRANQRVRLVRVPGGGLQPQVALDAAGGVHLVYFIGDAAGGNIDYVVSHDGGQTYSAPLQVNSIANSAVAMGNMRGAHLAVGNDGAIDVAWVGPNENGRVPMWFSRLRPGQKAFAPQRNLAPAMPLDGGAVASAGDVVEVYWHGQPPGKKLEADRQVWVARSDNGGRSFAPARPLYAQLGRGPGVPGPVERKRVARRSRAGSRASQWTTPTGVCGCCGMAAAADERDHFFVIYRAATAMVHRDLYLLHSDRGGRRFAGADFSPWQVGYCVMSTAQLSRSPIGLVAAWEQRGQVLWARVEGDRMGAGHAAPGAAKDRKYPAITANAHHQVLMAWTEGMGWKRGGSLHWQLFDEQGSPLPQSGSRPGVPAWSLVAAFAHPDGSFTILY